MMKMLYNTFFLYNLHNFILLKFGLHIFYDKSINNLLVKPLNYLIEEIPPSFILLNTNDKTLIVRKTF